VSTTLDGVDFALDVRWNSREESWYLDINTSDGIAIKQGIKIVLGAKLGVTSHPLRPTGTFLAVDLSGAGLKPTLDDLGTRVIVLYYSDV
jgi:hypothetical protein